MKAIVLKAFKDGSTGIRYEEKQTVDFESKKIETLETLRLVSKTEEISKPKRTSKKILDD